jgi:hypothetical protein
MQSRASSRGVTGWQFAIFTALNWCGWEFIRAELFPLKFPWMTAGLAMGPNALLPWIGVYGVGLFVILSRNCFHFSDLSLACLQSLQIYPPAYNRPNRCRTPGSCGNRRTQCSPRPNLARRTRPTRP